MKSFSEQCYDLMKKLPQGRVTTYGEIARALNSNAHRAVGRAMNKNPYKDVPCHRVVCSNAGIGGFAHGVDKKIELLKKEGIKISNNRIVEFENKIFRFKK